MKLMNRYAWRAMWRNRTRTLVTIAGIILSAAMFSGVATLGVSILNYLMGVEIYNSGDYFVRFDYVLPDEVETIRNREEISRMGTASILGYIDGEYGCVLASGDADFYDMMPMHLKKGRLPQNSSELIIPEVIREIYGWDLGDTVTLDVQTLLPADSIRFETAKGQPFQKDYLVVGFWDMTSGYLDDYDLYMSHIFTRDATETTLWSRCFAKTADPRDARVLEEEGLSRVSSVNGNLLNYYGASQYTNINEMIYSICAVLMAIILVGSVSLIYNAFSISLSERTRDFGLLRSVGTTKKQLRKSVYFEGLVLSAIGIPLGVLCGYVGIAVTLYFVGDLFTGLTTGSAESGLRLRALVSWPAFGCAAAVAVLTVLISARIPLKRSLRVEPIPAIRQTMDYEIPKKGVRVRPWVLKTFGIGGLLAEKYYKVSRKKYRSTIVSLAVSVVLFLSTVSFTAVFREVGRQSVNTYNYDLGVYDLTQAQVEELRSHPQVAESVLVQSTGYHILVNPELLTEDYKRDWNRWATSDGAYNADISLKNLNCSFLEDDAFRAYCESQGIDPEPYFTSENPMGLLCHSKIQYYVQSGEDYNRYVAESKVLKEEGVSFQVATGAAWPAEIIELLGQLGDGYYTEDYVLDGQAITTFDFEFGSLYENARAICPWVTESGALSLLRRYENDRLAYYFFDPATGLTSEEPLAVAGNLQTVTVGAQIEALPFGIREPSGRNSLVLVLPMSRWFESPEELYLNLNVKVGEYLPLKHWLDENGYNYTDHLHNQMQYRNLVTMINVFTYGFLILISLICVCNVFNTISTNIALRRRDFGMLRSVGMEEQQLRRMMVLECLRYGFQSLLWGLPMGGFLGWGIYQSFGLEEPYQLPLGAMGLAVLGVFTVVFITMVYALGKLRKDVPIEAVRTANL